MTPPILASKTLEMNRKVIPIEANRKIIGLSGFAGQQILIDIDAKRIIVVNSLYKNYDWKKIVYDKIKN